MGVILIYFLDVLENARLEWGWFYFFKIIFHIIFVSTICIFFNEIFPVNELENFNFHTTILAIKIVIFLNAQAVIK